MTVELTLLSRVRWRGEEITGSRLRGLLTLLAGDLPGGCGTTRLVESLWPDELPEHPAKALQTLVSRARARLGPDVILSTPTGYRLALGPEQIDATAALLRAAEAERAARANDHATALEQAESGLALFGEEGSPTKQKLNRVRAISLARLSRTNEALEPLTALIAEHPRDEEALLELLRCEADTAGPAAALTRYDTYRRELRDALGTDPGQQLRALHRDLLLTDAPLVRQGLRHEPNELLGRDDDITAVTDLLRTARVVSIVGPGGLGKTRLAQAVAREARQRLIYVVELAGSAADVLVTVASALGVGDRGDLINGVVGALGPGPALLVLDNCEHVVDSAAALVQALVSRSADLRILTTSRSPLGLSSESVHPLPELDLPTTVELFVRRARAARPGMRLPPEQIAELCARLDGLPLAVELAAARVRIMSVAEISRRLDDRFALLQGGSRDAPQRHRTLHAVIDWSWHLLDPAGRAAMRALSIFPDGFTDEAVRHVAGDPAVVEQLADQSLLKVADGPHGTRLRMLETVREFSAARRDEAGETEAVITRFLAWAQDLGTRDDNPANSAALVEAVENIRTEQPNLVRALQYALDRDDRPSVAATAALLGTLWLTDSNIVRLTALAAEVAGPLARYRPEPQFVEATRTAAVWCALVTYLVRGPRPLRALAVLRRLPPAPPGSLIGAAQEVLGASGVPKLKDLCGNDSPVVAGLAHYALSLLAEQAGDAQEALAAGRQMLACLADADPWLRALAHARIGELCLQSAPGDEAFRHIDAAVSIMEELGAHASATRARWALVLADLQRGAFDQAEAGLEQLSRRASLSAHKDAPALFDVCTRAEILLGRGDTEAGLRLWREAAHGLHDHHGQWGLEVRAAAVIAHCRNGRLDLATSLADSMPGRLRAFLPTAPAASFRICGVALLAIALTDLSRGVTATAVRKVALAERFGFSRTFRSTISVAETQDADQPAYAAAMAEYAGLDQAGLRAAALSLVPAEQ